MDITDVRIKMLRGGADRLRAFCSVTLDDSFVVRDVKIIDGTNGPFVAMPSRKISDRCPKCGGKNHMQARFCNDCGAKLKENRIPKDSQGRNKLHAEIAHPIKTEFRDQIQKAVIEAYEKQLEYDSSEEAGFGSPTGYDDGYGSDSQSLLNAVGNKAPESRDAESSAETESSRVHTEKTISTGDGFSNGIV